MMDFPPSTIFVAPDMTARLDTLSVVDQWDRKREKSQETYCLYRFLAVSRQVNLATQPAVYSPIYVPFSYVTTGSKAPMLGVCTSALHVLLLCRYQKGM
jgi:hypothetical protein